MSGVAGKEILDHDNWCDCFMMSVTVFLLVPGSQAVWQQERALNSLYDFYPDFALSRESRARTTVIALKSINIDKSYLSLIIRLC